MSQRISLSIIGISSVLDYAGHCVTTLEGKSEEKEGGRQKDSIGQHSWNIGQFLLAHYN